MECVSVHLCGCGSRRDRDERRKEEEEGCPARSCSSHPLLRLARVLLLRTCGTSTPGSLLGSQAVLTVLGQLATSIRRLPRSSRSPSQSTRFASPLRTRYALFILVFTSLRPYNPLPLALPASRTSSLPTRTEMTASPTAAARLSFASLQSAICAEPVRCSARRRRGRLRRRRGSEGKR